MGGIQAGAAETPDTGQAAEASAEAFAILRLRYWQHILNEMLKRKLFKIPVHLAFGHEAAAVALDRCMAAGDALCLSHRNVAYNLARSKSLDRLLAHYRLEAGPAAKGKMGSMNLAAEDTSIAYASSILGNNLPVAAGIAMHRKLKQRGGVVFVATGDGAMEEGAFWETLLMARSHGLGLVIVVENNDYSMSSTIAQRRSQVHLDRVCAGVGMQFQRVAGAAYRETLAALRAARACAAAGAPACVELDLATFNQHAGPTPGWPDDPLRIALEDGLLVKDDPSDPLHHIRRDLGTAAYDRLADKIIKADSVEKYLY